MRCRSAVRHAGCTTTRKGFLQRFSPSVNTYAVQRCPAVCSGYSQNCACTPSSRRDRVRASSFDAAAEPSSCSTRSWSLCISARCSRSVASITTVVATDPSNEMSANQSCPLFTARCPNRCPNRQSRCPNQSLPRGHQSRFPTPPRPRHYPNRSHRFPTRQRGCWRGWNRPSDRVA